MKAAASTMCPRPAGNREMALPSAENDWIRPTTIGVDHRDRVASREDARRVQAHCGRRMRWHVEARLKLAVDFGLRSRAARIESSSLHGLESSGLRLVIRELRR